MKKEKYYKFHEFLYKAARKYLCPVILKKYSYKTDICPEIAEPCIVFSNHLTESDIFMVGSAFPKHMYFVCGEHLMRSKIGGFLRFAANPISAPRGGNMTQTALKIFRRIKNGHNVMMFPEGARSFNGETLLLNKKHAELVKKAGCGLVTYRISGGYFIAPRWSYHTRKGHAEGKIVRVYSSAEIKDMTLDELTTCINEDLHENAYETQKSFHLPYYSDKKAEGLENYLLMCPKCKQLDTMKTNGNGFYCKACGLSGIYDDYGMLKGKNLPFSTVYDWGKWMEREFDKEFEKHNEDELCFSENGITVYKIKNDKRKDEIKSGLLSVFTNKLIIDGKTFDFGNISSKSLLYFGKTWLFTYNGEYYGLTGENYHAWKTDRIFDLFKKRKCVTNDI